MGILHRVLARLDIAVPRPVVSTFASPATLRRWTKIGETAVKGDAEAIEIVHLLSRLIRRLRNQWISSSEIPVQLIHGDIRLSNVCSVEDGEIVFFDFGFAARRPRIHDLAYALAFIVLVQGGHERPDTYPWANVDKLVKAYESAAKSLVPIRTKSAGSIHCSSADVPSSRRGIVKQRNARVSPKAISSRPK